MTDDRWAEDREPGILHARVWFVGLIVGIFGVSITAMGSDRLGILIYTAAVLPMAASAFRRAGALDEAVSAVPAVGGWAFLLALGLVSTGLGDLPLVRYVPLAMAASQLMLLGLTVDSTVRPTLDRTPVPVAGHLSVAAGVSVLSLSPSGLPLLGLLLGTLGFSLLLFEAYWVHPAERGQKMATGWEDTFLLVLAASLLVVTVFVGQGERLGVASAHLTATVLSTMHAMFLFGVAILAMPEAHIQRLEVLSGPIPEMIAEATTFVLFLHAAFLALVLAASWFLGVVFWGLTAWLLAAVLLEYAALAHAGVVRFRGRPEDPGPIEEPMTMVLAARNEADVLRQTVPENLALDIPLEYLLVPAESSTDDTVEAARELADEHPDRVRVVPGTGGSKAADLNQAWEEVTSDLVLVLDADEVLEPGTLRWGLAKLREDESVGVVQGRKKGRGEPDGWLDRFVRAERRFSTLLDHPMQNDVFGAAHFAGSGALVRHEVPPEVGGWDPAMLTEDIDFSLRLRSETDWRIVYEPRMAVWETDPPDLPGFVRQRGRWARGWSQVAARHLLRLVTGRGRTPALERVGWTWQVTTAVSAPWAVFLPLMTFLWILGTVPALPPTWGAALLLVILPSRGLAYSAAYYRDAVSRDNWTLGGNLRVLLVSYLWILVGWVLQLQALYLEISGAPRTWKPTREAGGEDAVTGDR